MSKRFTDTEKWNWAWFRSLPADYQRLWIYVNDKCDVAGIWYVDMELAEFMLRVKLDKVESERLFANRIQVVGDRWLLSEFVSFQYGDLTSKNKMFGPVRSRLDQLEFQDGGFIPHLSPIDGGKDKEKEEVINKSPKGGVGEKAPRPLTDVQRVVLAWKGIIGMDLQDKNWDRTFFSRFSKPARELLEGFGGDWRRTVQCMEFVYNDLRSKNLDCKLETVVKHVHKFLEAEGGTNGRS